MPLQYLTGSHARAITNFSAIATTAFKSPPCPPPPSPPPTPLCQYNHHNSLDVDEVGEPLGEFNNFGLQSIAKASQRIIAPLQLQHIHGVAELQRRLVCIRERAVGGALTRSMPQCLLIS